MRSVRELSAGTRAALSNIGWLTFDRLFRLGGALLVNTLVARYLGPTAFGLVSLALAIYMLFNTFSNLGLDYLVVRDVVLHPEHTHEVMGTAFWLKGVTGVASAALAVVFTSATHRAEPALVLMVGLLSFAAISQAWDVIDYYFQALTLSRRTVVPKLVGFVLINLARVAAVYRHAPVMVFVEILAAEILVNELALVVGYRSYPHGIARWSWSRPRSRVLLRQGFPLLLAGLLVMIYMRTDQILLGYLVGERAVGFYSAAVRLSEIWYAIPLLVCNSVMPRLLRLLETDKALYYRRVQTVYNGLVLLSVAIAAMTVPISRPLIVLLFGAAYLPAAHILSIHIWTGVFVFMGALGSQQLIHEGMTAIELRRAAAGAVVNLGLNVLLIPRYGIAGSAYATLIAQCVSTYLMDAFSRRTWHIFRMKSYALSGVWLLRDGLRWKDV